MRLWGASIASTHISQAHTPLHPMQGNDSQTTHSEGLDATKYIERLEGTNHKSKPFVFGKASKKRDENAMIHAELNWKGDSFQTVHTSVMVDIGHRSIRDGCQMRYGGHAML